MSVQQHADTATGAVARGGYPRRLLLTVIAALTVFSSSMTIVSASLPTIADDLDSTESVLSWAVSDGSLFRKQ